MNDNDPNLKKLRRGEQSNIARTSHFITRLHPGTGARTVANLALEKFVTEPKTPGVSRVITAVEAARIALGYDPSPGINHAFECVRLALRDAYDELERRKKRDKKDR